MRQNKHESGQVIILALVALGLFIFGAIGLAIDGANLYLQRQMAQAAADAAAQAAMMSIFNHTNSSSPAKTTDFTAVRGSTWDCAGLVADPRTPCVYALRNGFGAKASDTVRVYYPDPAEVPGIGDLSDDPVNLVQVTAIRAVDTTLMRMLGANATTIRARAVAAILTEVAPVPILVTHPTLPESLKVQGNPTIQVCGGPDQSIQVNSSSISPALPAYASGGSADIDLSRAGRDSDGTCLDSPTGADFGVFGGLAAASLASQGDLVNDVNLGPDGDYIQPSSPIEDPLKDVGYPARPGGPGAPALMPVATCQAACANFGINPAKCTGTCRLYKPGYYNTGIHVKNEVGIFEPGIYFMDNGDNKDVAFGNEANGIILPCHTCADYPWPDLAGTGTVAGKGVLIYNASPTTGPAQVFDVGANSIAILWGTPLDSIYKGIAFFQNRESLAPSTSPTVEHRFGGGGGLAVIGTLYITNTREIMENNPLQYQPVLLQGNPGSATTIIGQIIVSTLRLGGSGEITMKLSPDEIYTIRKVALVK